MKIIQSKSTENLNLPLQLSISFEKVFAVYRKYSSKKNETHPFHKSSKVILKKLEKYPELIEGFSDFSLLEKHNKQIDLLLNPLFPEALLLNEIKAASIPFSFTMFKFSTRFENILKNADEGHEITLRNFEDDALYIYACTMILATVHGYVVDLKRPFFFDIPDVKSGFIKHYRAAFNNDFSEIIPTENAPTITEDDYKLLLDNFNNIDLWKEKFPPNSYIYKGFGIMNLFDVTADETISNIRTNLLRSDQNLTTDIQNNLRKFFQIKDLLLGFSIFDLTSKNSSSLRTKNSESLVLNNDLEIRCSSFFCDDTIDTLFNKKESIAISDVEKYGKNSNKNLFYQRMQAKGIGSILLIPIETPNTNDLAVLEIASPRPFELNSINENKLKDIIPVFEAAVKRSSEEHLNILEATIQEHYTSIHPSIKWRFIKAAEKYQKELHEGIENPTLDEIIFNDVYPLFGQSDIKGSSIARNEAIKEDLTIQLTLAIGILNGAYKNEKLPIYEELIFRVNQYLENVNDGLKAGDEIVIIDFLKQDIYPVFSHLKKGNEDLSKQIATYSNRLDKKLHVVYEKRKDYEDSVTLLNEKLTSFIDKKQEETQEMFPHYFERYKTDGVEYNMYIGQSLVQNKPFNKLYLYNLRLWQLQMMYEVENIAYQARNEMKHELRVASLILVHSNSLSIKFRMDEKQFDVDGAYNIRYEIIKKRIDKAHIKGTTNRLTVPGKIAIVYSQEKDAREYAKYLRFLQSKQFFGKIEDLEIEDLQGVSGLKALRVEVLYKTDFEKTTFTFQELIEEIKQ